MNREYKVRYKQIYLGKELYDSYNRCLDDETENISDIYSALYEDPHVIWVDIKEIPVSVSETIK